MLDDPENYRKLPSGVAALCAIADQGTSALSEAYKQKVSIQQRRMIMGNLIAHIKADQEKNLVPLLVHALNTESDTSIKFSSFEILLRFKVMTTDEELTEWLVAIPTGITSDYTNGEKHMTSMSSCLALGNFAAHGNPQALTAL